MWGVSVLSSGSHLGRRARDDSPHISKKFFPSALRRIWELLAGTKENLVCFHLVTFSDPYWRLALELNQPALREVKVVARSLRAHRNLSILIPERRGGKCQRNKGQENAKRLHGSELRAPAWGNRTSTDGCGHVTARQNWTPFGSVQFLPTPCPRPG